MGDLLVAMKDSTDKMDTTDSTLLEDPGSPHTFHNPEPDFTGPPLEIPPENRKRILGHLNFLYGESVANAYMPELERILDVYYAHKTEALIEKKKGVDPKSACIPTGLRIKARGCSAALPRVEHRHSTLPRRGCVRWRRMAGVNPLPPP